MLKQDKNGIKVKGWNDVEYQRQPERGKGTIAYTVRRIQMLEDKLKELKKDLKAGKYDFKG